MRRHSKTRTLTPLGMLMVGSLLVGITLAVTIQLAHGKAFSTSQDFVQKAVADDNFEVQSAQIALNRSHSKAIRSFAQRVMDDHAKADSQLKSILASTTVQPSAVQSGLDEGGQAMLIRLKTVPDYAFDDEYIRTQEAMHAEAYTLYRDYSKIGNDPQLKSFASDTLPTIASHQDTVRDLADSNDY
ncbi:MAG: DUF4142 domain-containing protein [Pseudomonadota bacterium]|nr:DUF4142 domain-containing protein [Pseudomonadota bacterium]